MNKAVRDSYTEQVQILNQANMNGYNRLFGGQLMQWIDVVAAVVARRHCGMNVTTAMVDSLVFKDAARLNDTMLITGRVVFVGRTSMEVRVDVYVEALGGARRLVNTAYLVMVALGADERPARVPGLTLATQDERREWEQAQARYALRKREKDGKSGGDHHETES